MKIGMIWSTAEPYFPKVYITRKYDRDSSMAAAGARGCCVMDLVGDGVSLQATSNHRSLAVLPWHDIESVCWCGDTHSA